MSYHDYIASSYCDSCGKIYIPSFVCNDGEISLKLNAQCSCYDNYETLIDNLEKDFEG